MPLAALSAEYVILIIGAVVAGIVKIIEIRNANKKEIDRIARENAREDAQIERERLAAEKAAERAKVVAGEVQNVKATLEAATEKQSEHLVKQDEVLVAIVDKVEEVHHSTNGLTKLLGDAKLAQGIAEGTATGLQQGRDEVAQTAVDPSASQVNAALDEIKPQVKDIHETVVPKKRKP